MYFLTTFIICVLVQLVVGQDTVFFQVERFAKHKQAHFRATTSEHWSVAFSRNDVLDIPFCTRKPVTFRVKNVRYSNDGFSDKIQLSLDGAVLGTFQTHSRSQNGVLWAEVNPSGPVGVPVQLAVGTHTLQLKVVAADMYGVELDVVEVEVTGSLDGDMLNCGGYCDNRILYKPPNTTAKTIKGSIRQNVREPLCPEDRNINIPLFHDDPAAGYKITAKRPQYSSVANNIKSHLQGCKGPDVLWTFSQIIAAPYSETINIPGAKMTFTGKPHSMATVIDIIFTPSEVEMPDSYQILGGILKLATVNPTPGGATYVKLEIRQNNEYVPYGAYQDASLEPVEWVLSEYNMYKNTENAFRISVVGDIYNAPSFEYIRLEKIPKKTDTKNQLYEDSEISIVAMQIDQWWLTPQSMDISIQGNSTMLPRQNVIKVFKTIPYHTKKFELLNLFSDGELKVNAVPPEGVDVVPFGTSVIVGKSELQTYRPNAPISAIIVDPITLSLHLTYVDGSTTTLVVSVVREDTEVMVKEITFPASKRTDPLAAIRSSWINDGVSDVDHVSVDNVDPRAIKESRWQSFYGQFFSFFRRCVGTTDTQSSDITIQLFSSQV